LPHIIIVFSSAAAAEYRVAGIPAAARAVHAIGAIAEQDGVDRCSIFVDETWVPSGVLVSECRRLAPDFPAAFSAKPAIRNALIIRGEAFVASLARRPSERTRETVLPALFDASIKGVVSIPPASGRPDAGVKMLRRANRNVLTGTGKGGDGIVSRYINRPISRAISCQLLRIPAVTPFHASLGTALLGLVMAAALFFGGEVGLVAGALLFQAASIFDGVDGEIARATYRTSDEGATLDSIIDAFTNLAFITGVTVNVGFAGDASGAVAGSIALVTLAAGLLLIGRHARTMGEPMNFDVIKRHFRSKGRASRLSECLIHLTMRDFFAAACAIMVVLGYTHLLLFAFATISLGWLAVTATVLGQAKQRPICNDRRSSSVVASNPS
jgi:CDP-L-myo-inositol myo-inositolphosphotransferase